MPMMFWIVLALMTAAVSLSVLVAVSRARHAPLREENDIEVFRQQLAEVEDDLRTGAVSEEMAEAARTEISRRLLAAKREADGRAANQPASQGAWGLRVAAIVAMPVLALGLYFWVGAPGVPDQPLAERQAQLNRNPDINQLIARTEEHLAQNPDDVQGWMVLAPVYARQGAYDKAEAAYAQAIRIAGPTPALELARAEMLIFQQQGTVTAEAEEMLKRVTSAAPDQAKPRFYLALALTQQGQTAAAITAWRNLLADANGDEPWVAAARAQLNMLTDQSGSSIVSGQETAPTEAKSDERRGPTREDIEAAQDMTAQDRQAMVAGMVAQLESRLAEDGGSVQEWSRLVRSLIVIGEEQRAQDALEAARTAFEGDAEAEAQLDGVAQALGLN